MYYAVFIYVFCECILSTRSKHTSTIYKSAPNPRHIKLKIRSAISFPTEDKLVEHPLYYSTENDHQQDLKLTDTKEFEPVERESDEESHEEEGMALDEGMLRENNFDGDVNDSKTEVIRLATDKQGSRENNYHEVDASKLRSGTPGVGVTRMTHEKPRVQDNERIQKFTEHVYRQTLKAFEAMKQKSDSFTQQKLDTLAKSYKEKFTDFVLRTRQTHIKTREGTRNVLLHILETSNLMMDRIVNFLKTEMNNTDESVLRGGVARLDKEVATVKQLENEHACKKFGVCRNSQGFRVVLQDLISILIKLPDAKLIQFNDALTEIFNNIDLSPIAINEKTQATLKKLIKTQERMNVDTLRFTLSILYGALSKSHLPLVVNKALYFVKPVVKRTVVFHRFIDALEDSLPPTEGNKREWAIARNRLTRWADDQPLDVQEILQGFVYNSMKGVAKSVNIKDLVGDMVKPIL